MKNITLIIPLIFLLGCGSKAEEKKPDAVKTTLQIRSSKDTNQGTPFFAVVKSTDYPQFCLDNYQKMVNEVLIGKDDPTQLETSCFIPGETKTIEVESKDNKNVAIYFIFTHPGEKWKYFTDEGEGHNIKILLGENQIKSVRSF